MQPGEGHVRGAMAPRGGLGAVLGLLLVHLGLGLGLVGARLLLGHLLLAVRGRSGLARLALRLGRPFLRLLLGRAHRVLHLHLRRLHPRRSSEKASAGVYVCVLVLVLGRSADAWNV